MKSKNRGRAEVAVFSPVHPGGGPEIPAGGTYNHMVDIGFVIISLTADGRDITPAMMRSALHRRIANLDANESEWLEAVSPPLDTYQIEEAAAQEASA
jgi:hypothetical protein